MAIENLDFLNLNSLRNFPIKEGKSRVDDSGVLTIPNDFLVDMELGVNSDAGVSYFVSKIVNVIDTVLLEVSNSSLEVIGTFSIDPATHTKNTVYQLSPTNDFVGTNGSVTIGSLDSILAGPAGSYAFSLANTELEMRVSTISTEGINRIRFINTDGTSFTLSGDVEIDARTNLRFKAGTGNRVIIDAGNGLGLNTDCLDQLACIKTINGIGPDETGNFTLDFSDCAVLTPIPANTGLILEDNCCKPCVGCSDIGELTSRLMELESSLIQLRDYYNSLTLLYEQFKTTTSYTCDCPPGS